MNARDLIAVDPGSTAPGLSWFRDGELRAAVTIKVSGDASARILKVADAAVEWLKSTLPADIVMNNTGVDLICEWPKIYPNNKAKKNRRVNPAGILVLAGAAGAILGGIAVSKIGPLIVSLDRPEPAEWIGQLPKGEGKTDPRKSPRGSLIASCLSPAELARLPLEHDAYDSAGLGLWKLGRLKLRVRFARPGDPGVARRPPA